MALLLYVHVGLLLLSSAMLVWTVATFWRDRPSVIETGQVMASQRHLSLSNNAWGRISPSMTSRSK